MLILLMVTAQAGPLDNPDGEEMSGYRCVDRPLKGPVAPVMKDRTVGTTPPGPPVLPDALSRELVRYATDDALKKAGRPRYVMAVEAVASLATLGEPVIRACESRATDRDDFSFGCTDARRCDWYVKRNGATVKLPTRPQVALQFAPVDSIPEAVGLLRFYEANLFLPLTPREREAWAKEASAYHLAEPAIPWLEVEAYPEGWLIQAPRRLVCGCNQDIVRQAYWVAHDGRSCVLNLPAEAIAMRTDGACKD